MKTIKLLLLAFTALMITRSNAQTVDEIINKNLDAMGGKEKLSTLKTVKMTGSMSTQGIDIPITITKSHMTGMRMEFEVMGNSNYQTANAKQGWTYMPVRQMTAPEEMDAESYKSFSNQMDIQSPFLNYKEKGTSIELAGSEKVDGSDAYNLKMTYKNGRTANYFIDKKTNRLIKSSAKANVQGQEMDVETLFSDYKQNKDGYWFPYTVTSMQGPIIFDSVETNMPVDEKIYAN